MPDHISYATYNFGLSKLSPMSFKFITVIFNVKILTEICLTCSNIHKFQAYSSVSEFFHVSM